MKTKITLFAMFLMLTCFGYNAQAKEEINTKAQMEVRAMEIKNRVDEIKAMDFSKLSTAERKDIRHELKGMNKELRQMSPIIFISGGALIIIIILLILLL